MKKISAIASEVAILLATSATFVHAQNPFNIEPTGIIKAGSTADIGKVVTFVVGVLSVIAVLATLFYLVWGAIKWIMSGGDKSKVEAARGQIVAAIIGFVIVVLSFVIINVVAQILGLGNIFTGLKVPTI